MNDPETYHPGNEIDIDCCTSKLKLQKYGPGAFGEEDCTAQGDDSDSTSNRTSLSILFYKKYRISELSHILEGDNWLLMDQLEVKVEMRECTENATERDVISNRRAKITGDSFMRYQNTMERTEGDK